MRFLIVIGGFFPGKKCGGPPVSVDNFCSLMKEHEIYIVTVNHDLFDSKPYEDICDGWNDRGNCKVLYLEDTQYNKNTFRKVINEIKPDVLYLQGIFQSCILPCLQLAKEYGIKVLLAPRGELCEGAFNLKRYKKKPYVKLIRALGLVKNVNWQSTSDEETEAIKKLMKASDDCIYRLDNIPSIPHKEYTRREKKAGEARFVFLSRIHPKKNLLVAINFFERICGEVQFDIYGPVEDERYWKECQLAIENLPVNVKVRYCGLVSHDQVHEIFSQYDAFLFPTLSENYGHVIAESLMTGTPVIISDQTPWTDVEENASGYALPLSDKDSFERAINKIICADYIDCESVIRYAKEKTQINDIKDAYQTAFEKVCYKNK